MIEFLRKVITFFKLRRLLVTKIIKYIYVIKKNWIVQRDGIKYKLDISRTIDFFIFLGGWERGTIKFLKNKLKNKNTVIEVGSNIGSHTLLIASIVGNEGQVIAIEPTKYGINKLIGNIELNKNLKNIKILQYFISNKNYKVDSINLKTSWSLKHDKSDEFLNKPKVTTIDNICDDLKLKKIDLIKIDVDGFDFKVLEGSYKAIKIFKPVILCELCQLTLKKYGNSVEEIFNFFDSLNYKCENEKDGSSMNLDKVLKLIGTTGSINGVFVPKKSY